MPAILYVSIACLSRPAWSPPQKKYAPFRASRALVRSHAGPRSDRASIFPRLTAASISLAGPYHFPPSERVFIPVRGPQVHRDRAEAPPHKSSGLNRDLIRAQGRAVRQLAG